MDLRSVLHFYHLHNGGNDDDMTMTIVTIITTRGGGGGSGSVCGRRGRVSDGSNDAPLL